MDTPDWTQLETLFEKALSLSGEERAAFLASVAEHNPEAGAELASMLEAYEAAPGFFDSMRRSVYGGKAPTQPPAPAGSAFQAGARVNQYTIERELGAGGMGVVFLARDTRLNRPVALKFLPFLRHGDQELRRRFLQEAQAASALDHPNVCTIYEFNETADGVHFIAMGYYQGETLKARMKRPIPLPEALDYARQLVRGLAHAHANGIVHRDIKPDNVMVTEGGVVKVLDFGLAKMAGVDLTRTGMTMGTVAYMSPEQARGETVDHRSDIWSVGVLLYELFSGVRPFKGDYDQAVIYSILNETPPPLTAHDASLPAELDAVLARCLEKDPAARYDSATTLLAGLERLGREEAAPSPLPATRRRPNLRIAAALVGMAILVAAVFLGGRLFSSEKAILKADDLRLAVLPFTNIGADSALVDGLLFTVSSKLALMERFQGAMTVVPPSEVQAEQIRSVASAADMLNANLVLGGSVQEGSDGLRLTLQLVNANSNSVVNSTVLEIARSGMGELDDRIVESLASLLDLQLSAETQEFLTAGQSRDAQAYSDYTRAQGYLQKYEDGSNLDASISLLNLAIKEDPSFALAYAGLGEAYVLKYELDKDPQWIDEAIRYGQRAIELDDDLGPVRLTMGMIYLNTGNYVEAERQFLRAYVLDGENVEAQYQLGRVYRSLAEYDKAEEFYRKAIERRPDNWQYYIALGNLYHEMGRHEAAMPMYERVIALRPTNPWGYNNLAAQYQRLGRLDEAVPLYMKAVDVNPNATSARALAFNNLGGIAYTRDAFAEAAGYYQESVALQNAQLDSWDQLGNAYHWLGEDARARTAWDSTDALARRRLAVNPRDEGALSSGLEAAAKRGDASTVAEYVARIEELAPNSSTLLVTIGKAYEIAGRREEALRYLQRGFENGYEPGLLEASAWMDDLRASEAYAGLIEGADSGAN